MADLPSGTVTFLFTDIEGSTALWERDRAAMAAAVERHIVLLDTAIHAHEGVHFKTVGDAVQAAFPTAPDAVAAALDAQRTLQSERWPKSVANLSVRMALHSTAAEPQDGDYLTSGLNRLARLLAAGHGGQVLVSAATQELARDVLPPESVCAISGSIRCATCTAPSGSSNSSTPTSRPVSRCCGRWPRALTTCRCSRRPSWGVRTR